MRCNQNDRRIGSMASVIAWLLLSGITLASPEVPGAPSRHAGVCSSMGGAGAS